MTPRDYVIALILGVFLYLGGYSVYFHLQERTHERSRPLSGWMSALDERIPLRAEWVWIYTALYYPTVVLAAVFTSRSLQEFAYTAVVYLALLGALTVGFLIMPVRTHEHWRAFDPEQSIHHRHLSWVQAIDGANNCFPSGHSAISVLTGYLLSKPLGTGPGTAFAVLVCLSCLYCKQHYLLDVLGGAVVGAGCIWLHLHLVA